MGTLELVRANRRASFRNLHPNKAGAGELLGRPPALGQSNGTQFFRALLCHLGSEDRADTSPESKRCYLFFQCLSVVAGLATTVWRRVHILLPGSDRDRQ